MFTVDITFNGALAVMQGRGLDEGGKVQRFFSSEVMRTSNPYLPFKEGALQASARVTDDGEGIIYDTPYARYHWFGKLMVDPKTKKGAFYNPLTGRFWSRPNVQKELTDRDLRYNGAPMRGPHWVERAWIDHKDEIIKAVQEYAAGEAAK